MKPLRIALTKGRLEKEDVYKRQMSVIVRGDVEYDKYDHEIVLRPKGLSTVEQLKIVDDAPEKRVELHLHTNMSRDV